MQTLETLMLRLTTKVTVSPASSARSSSAAWRMSSIASGRSSAKSAVISSAVSAAPWRARAIAPATASRTLAGGGCAPDGARRLAPARAAPGDEAPVARLDDVEHALVDPLRVYVLAVDA